MSHRLPEADEWCLSLHGALVGPVNAERLNRIEDPDQFAIREFRSP
jgi:hypothetical protein